MKPSLTSHRSHNSLQSEFRASTGEIASFNWDTSSSSVSTSQYHLSDQYYDICIRRESGKCSICFSPNIVSSTTGTASSYGLGAGSSGPAQTNAIGVACTGVTTQPAAAGLGDYIEIANLQPGTGTAATINPAANRMCGQYCYSL